MAKRTAARRSGAIIKYRTPKPIIIRPRVAAPKKHHGHRRKAGHRGLQKTMIGSAIGGFLIGFIEKQFPNLPTLPIVGKKGAIAIGGYFLAQKGGQLGTIARDVATVAIGIAGYEFGTTGKVTGGLARQVSGLASQV